MDPLVYILIGHKGVGKTTLGKALASHLQMDFFDLDQLLLQKKGFETIRQCYQTLGEDTFRKEEYRLLETLIFKTQSILSLGGGTLESLQSQKLVKKMGPIIYLYIPFEKALEKFRNNPPPFSTDYENKLRNRENIFTDVATYTIKATQPFEKILDAFRENCHGL